MELHVRQGKVCKVVVGYDSTSSEKWAMLAAMFSRSSAGVEELAERIKNSDGDEFMSKFYVGYGHASIGELCDVRLFIEGVPFYVACQLEQFSRFRGQESSTRYIDFSKQAASPTADLDLYKEQVYNYTESFSIVATNLKGGRSVGPAEQRAINARAFDICRSLLPAGATTNVAWYGDIRTIEQHLAWLVSHKNRNAEITGIRGYVQDIFDALREVYPSSLHSDLSSMRTRNNYPSNNSCICEISAHAELDFGSWRDLNRHRLGVSYVNLDPSAFGPLHPWYEEMLQAHGVNMPKLHNKLDHILLGQLIDFRYSVMTEEHLEYMARLRTQLSVHPTLRMAFHKIPMNPGYMDMTPDPGPIAYFISRGNDTILVGGKELTGLNNCD